MSLHIYISVMYLATFIHFYNSVLASDQIQQFHWLVLALST